MKTLLLKIISEEEKWIEKGDDLIF